MISDYRGKQLPNRVDSVLLDFDGTLIDMRPKWWEPIERSFEKVTGSVPEKELENNIGRIFQKMPNKPSRLFMIRLMWQIGRAGGLNRLGTIKFMWYAVSDFRSSRFINILLPGAETVLNYLGTSNISVAIVTSAGKEEMDHVKKEISILTKIPFVSRDDVAEMKPHPEPVIQGMKRINADKNHTVFVGDFRTDIIAGKRAGTMTAAFLGVAPEISRPNLEGENPDIIILNLEELVQHIEFSRDAY